MLEEEFYINKSIEYVKHIYNLTKLGVSISLSSGDIVYEEGFCCSSCQMCKLANFSQLSCSNTHAYSLAESSRLGGKYIYLGPFGFTFLVSPIVKDNSIIAKVTMRPLNNYYKLNYNSYKK